jgi:hypothetical protein
MSVYRRMRKFLARLTSALQTSVQNIDAWPTSDPKQSLWDDAFADGVVRRTSRQQRSLAKTDVVQMWPRRGWP